MGSLFGGGGSSYPSPQYYSPAVYSQGGNPAPYVPSAPGAADQNYMNLVNSLYGQFMGGTTPAQQMYPWAYNAASNVANPPPAYLDPYQQAAITVGGQEQNLGAQEQAFASQYGNIPNLISGLASQVGAGVGPTQALAGEASAGIGPTQALAAQIAGGIAPLQQGASTILNTGYDPQSQLATQLSNQTTQAASAANAASGVQGPYAAGNINNATTQESIAWQNQQLQRQQAALQAAGSAYGVGGALGSAAGNLYGSAANQAGVAGNLWGSAANQAGESASLYSNVVPSANQIFGLQNRGLDTTLSGAGLPFNLNTSIYQNMLPTIQQASQQGQSQFQLPQNILADLAQYLQLQGTGSGLASREGGMGFNQNQAQLGDIGSLFGAGGLGLLGAGGALNFGGSGGGLVGGLSDAIWGPDQLAGISAADIAGIGGIFA